MSDPPADAPERPHVVAIGGGHGLSRTLAALARLPVATTAVVAMADDGGSSGRLRRDLGVGPPGDLRKALASLVPDTELARWFEHRFDAGELAGHSLGNLMLIAMQQARDGDLVGALDRLGALLGARGRVLPSTLAAVDLVAEGPGGRTTGQVAIARSRGHERVRLEPPDVAATAEAVAAIEAADLVVFGPGSLFTSILPNVVVGGVRAALERTPATLLLVANLREQPGETEGLDLPAHLDVLRAHLPERALDVLLAHAGPAPAGPGERLVAPPEHPHVHRVMTADLLDGADGHDPRGLAAALGQVLAGVDRTEPVT